MNLKQICLIIIIFLFFVSIVSSAQSPIDAGDPSSDYSNEPEPNGGRIDMGAYGNTNEATPSTYMYSNISINITPCVKECIKGLQYWEGSWENKSYTNWKIRPLENYTVADASDNRTVLLFSPNLTRVWLNTTIPESPNNQFKLLRNNTKFASVISDNNGTISYLYTGSFSTYNFTYQEEDNSILPSTPSNPVLLQVITGNFYINFTWTSLGNVTTDSYNVTINGSWYNTTNRYANNSVAPHGYNNVTVWGYNGTGNGNLSNGSANYNATIPNNVPVQAAIGNKEVTVGNWLNFTIDTTDADGDSISYGTNATNGNLIGYNYSWLPAEPDIGTYYWNFNSSDAYGGLAQENISVTVNYNNTDSFNISINGIWTNGTTDQFLYNDEVAPHGWRNISVYAYNSSGTGSLNTTPVSSNTQLANNIPVQAAIGNKSVNVGNWLNFTINTTDADGDTITYASNNTKGTLSGYNYSWLPTNPDVGTYYWNLNSSDGYGGLTQENITVTVSTNVYPLNTSIQCLYWCYLASNTSQTLLQIDNNQSNDTVQTKYNSTSKKFESHVTGYSPNQNSTVSNKEGYASYFTTLTYINTTYTSNPSINIISGWNLVGNLGTARSLSTLKSSITDATSASHWNNTQHLWINNDAEIVNIGESFMIYTTSDSTWSN